MGNRFYARLFIVCLSFAPSCSAQLLGVSKIKDQQAQALQQRYLAELRDLARDAANIHFPYPFYFSDALDIDEVRQKQLPVGSIHFDRFNGQMVLEITGNYYASYSAHLLSPNLRARQTFNDVILPLLTTVVAHVNRTVPFDAYAFEIAHHVRGKVLKVDTEGPENLMLLLPRAIAERLVQAKDTEGQQGALLESQVFLNGEPLTLWLTGDEAPADVNTHYVARFKTDSQSRESLTSASYEPGSLVNSRLIPEAELTRTMRERSKVPPDLSPIRLQKLQAANQDAVRHLTSDLKEQAHFVDYAPPSFIAFRDGAYLQLNLITDLGEPAGTSRYRIAALAFDTHVSHLLRPTAKYFHDNPQFEGIDFSTTVHQPGQGSPESVEFVVPFAALNCYEKYDCTGQELINRSVILIDGERVTLDLQRAETDSSSPK